MAPFLALRFSVLRRGVGSLRSAGCFHSDGATGRDGVPCPDVRVMASGVDSARLGLSIALELLSSVIQSPRTLSTRRLDAARMERRMRGILAKTGPRSSRLILAKVSLFCLQTSFASLIGKRPQLQTAVR